VNKARFETFSDGVFAFALTLLVLGFVLPKFAQIPPSEAQLTRGLLSLWPNLIAYFLSFSVIGVMWQNHHALFRLIRTIDRKTVFCNLMLLVVTAFIPFATSVLGTYPATRPATVLYGLTLTLASTAYNLMLNHLVKSRAFGDAVHPATIHATVFAYRVGWAMYSVAMLVAFFVPVASFALYLAIVIFYLIPRGADAD
jgi:uncharacterized membrane protein